MPNSTIIIGAGPAGLAAAAALTKRGIKPQVLEQSDELAHSWKTHYDRLKLNSIKQLSALPYMRMPANYPRYPTRAQIVSYLENYAQHFEINPKLATQVLSINRDGKQWNLECNNCTYSATNVVIATGFNHKPRIPDIPGVSTFPGKQIHSKEFRNGAAYKGQRVLVIGAGNSGVEIAMDLMEHSAQTSIMIRNPIHVTPLNLLGIVPVHLTSYLLNFLPLRMADFIAGLTLKMFVGDLSQYGINRPKKGPLRTLVEDNRVAMFDTGIIKHIKKGNIKVVPAVTNILGNTFTFTDGSTQEFDSIVYATGYDHNLSGILKNIINSPKYTNQMTTDGYPAHCGEDMGDGLYFIGFKESPRGMLADIRNQAISISKNITA